MRMAKKTKIQTYHHVHVHVQLKTCECLAGLMTKIIETSTVLLHHPRSGCLCKRLQRRGQWSSAQMSKLAFALPAAQVHWAHDSGTNHRHTIAWHSFHVKFERQSGGSAFGHAAQHIEMNGAQRSAREKALLKARSL